MNIEKNAICGVVDAILIARNAIKIGEAIPIKPCVSINPKGQEIACSDLDKTGKMVCKHSDGLLPVDNGVECPRQKGRLALIGKSYCQG